MLASFLFLPRDLTEQRISELERLLLLWEWVGRGLLDLIFGIRNGPLHGSGERNREAILAEFFEEDFGDLGERMALENVRDGVAHIEQEKSEAAVLLVGETHSWSRIPDTARTSSAAPSPHGVTIAESRRNLELTHFPKTKS